MYTTPHYAELKRYVGRKNFQNEGDIYPRYDKINALHRSHFRITDRQQNFLEKAAMTLGKTVNDLSALLIEKMLPLIETQVFRTVEELEEHHYNAGGYQTDLFVTLTEETFQMLQYLKETLHFYSYCEVFRFVVDYFMESCEWGEDGENVVDVKAKILNCIYQIRHECRRIYRIKKKACTIVQSILHRVRTTKGCLFHSGQIYLQKLLV